MVVSRIVDVMLPDRNLRCATMHDAINAFLKYAFGRTKLAMFNSGAATPYCLMQCFACLFCFSGRCRTCFTQGKNL